MVRAYYADDQSFIGETTVAVTDSKKIYVNVSDGQNKFPLYVSLNATELNYMGYAVDEYGNYVPGVEITWENNNNDAYALSATPYTDVDSGIIQYYIFSITDLKEMGDVSFSSDIHDQKYQHETQTWNFEITETTANSMGFDVLPNGVLFVDEPYKVSAWVYDQHGLKTTLPIKWEFTNLKNKSSNNNYQTVSPLGVGHARIEAKYGDLYVYHDITIGTEEISGIRISCSSLEIPKDGHRNLDVELLNQNGDRISGDLAGSHSLTVSGGDSYLDTTIREVGQSVYSVDIYAKEVIPSPITLTFTYGGNSANLLVEVYEPELRRIEIGGAESLSVGTLGNLFVDLYDQNDNIIRSTSDYSILWNIAPKGILEIENVFHSNAEVFALKEGEVEVTASCNGITSVVPYQVTVEPLEITNMDIVIGRDSCPLGSPINFQAKALSNGNPVSAPSEKVAWVITDASDSTIKSGQASFGEIVEYTPKALGTYTVKLTYNTLTAKETIEVYEATPSYVLYMESQTLEVGTEQMYHFFVCDQHKYPIDDEEIIADLSWEITSGSEFAEIEVSEFNYFTLTSTGKLGSVTLIPKYKDDKLPIILERGVESVSLIIKVFNPANVGKITINEFSIPSIIETDSSSLIRTTSYDTNGYCLVNPELTWTVDNPEILKFVNPGSESPGLVDSITVKSEGEMFIHALSPGTATITISSGTVSVSLNIKVYAPEPTSIKTIQSSSSFAVGETTLITVEVYDQMDSFCSEAEVRYQVDNTIVDVSYDEDLKILSITPKKTGSTTLKIFSGRASTSIPITVLENPSLTITCDDAVIYGFTQTTIRGVANVHTVYLYVQTGSGEYCEFEDVNSHGISVSNGKWEYSFTPSEEFIHTNQIIRVTGERYNVLDGTVTQPSLNSDIPYAEIKLNIEYPGVVIIETEKSSDKIGVIGTAVGAETLQYYLFDAEGIRTGTIPVNPSEYTYSLEIDRSEIHGWECYLLLQHPYTDNLFNLKLDGTTLSIYDTEESGLASEASNSLSLDNKYGKEAYDIVVDFIDHELDAYDYSRFNFVNPPEISPAEGVYESPLTITLTTDIVGAKIYYTVDGEDFLEYSSPLVISDVTEEFTIGAVTVVDEIMSNVKYAVFSITEDTSSSTSSSKNTGSGNYNEYPRTVTNGGEVSFGTAKIVKSVDLPKGLSGEVKLIAKSETPGPEGKETYNVFEINIPNYPKGEKAVIRFTISAAELEAKGFGPADIRLYHYDEENGWTPLSTSYKVTNDGVSYESETDSFSPFAIVFEKGAATERVDAEVPEDIPGVTPGDDEPLPSIPDTPTETPQTPSPVFGVIAGLLGAGLLLRRK